MWCFAWTGAAAAALLLASFSLPCCGSFHSPRSIASPKTSRGVPLSAVSIPRRCTNDRHCQDRRHSGLRFTVLTLLAKENNEEADEVPIDEQDIETLLNSVTDAEALLACRAHLQRTNQLDAWTAGKERTLKRQLALLHAKQSDAVGFFWEDPDELVYYDRTKSPLYAFPAEIKRNFQTIEGTEYGMEYPEEESNEEEVSGTIFFSRSNIQQSFDLSPGPSIVESDDIWDNAHNVLPEEQYSSSESYFRWDEVTPSTSHNRRSNATKRMFADPAWKAAWYERRWGRKGVKTKQIKKQQSLEERMHSPNMDHFLSNAKLSAMDEDEIAGAIRTYLTSNQKRSAGRRQTLQRRKEILRRPVAVVDRVDGGSHQPPLVLRTPSPLSRDSLFRPDTAALQDRRERRAEKAVEIYQRRLENQKETTKRVRSKVILSPLSLAPTPNDALKRIERLLDEPGCVYGDLRQLSDLELDLNLILVPDKLPKRKEFLRRILGDIFDLRGKCVPAETEEGREEQYRFVTKCSIEDLGAFVLQTINQRQEAIRQCGTRNM